MTFLGCAMQGVEFTEDLRCVGTTVLLEARFFSSPRKGVVALGACAWDVQGKAIAVTMPALIVLTL